jgi:hypothetical protein
MGHAVDRLRCKLGRYLVKPRDRGGRPRAAAA